MISFKSFKRLRIEAKNKRKLRHFLARDIGSLLHQNQLISRIWRKKFEALMSNLVFVQLARSYGHRDHFTVGIVVFA
jgi:predicted AAA+ superfamily ATPase